MARVVWRDASPVGTHIRLEDSQGARVYEVVGVAAGVRHFALDETPLGLDTVARTLAVTRC